MTVGYHTLLKIKPLLPTFYQAKLPGKKRTKAVSDHTTTRTMIGFQGCVQSALTPETLNAAKFVLRHFGINLVRLKKEGCCGALNLHLSERDRAIKQAKDNIDAWWPAIENGAEAIVISASGCGVSIKEYPHLFLGDKDYNFKARKVVSLAKDLSEIVANEDIESLSLQDDDQRIAIHCPCTLQHGLKLNSVYVSVFNRLGLTTVNTAEDHLCCGSAGSYSLLQPDLSNRLKQRKLKALTQDTPDLIVTANIGCQLHLDADSETPVKHWIEVIAERLESKKTPDH
nr:heterodisulfide reductase-related iron-sulfur binding cluster [Enterovibrio nigricans]